MRKILDKYFERPVFWDYSVVFLTNVSLCLGVWKGFILVSDAKQISDLSTDLATVSLTSTGFILTLLSVLITFKFSTKKSDSEINERKEATFHLFFRSTLYYKTVSLFKNCIKSLLFISVVGYLFKLIFYSNPLYIFIYNISALIVIVLTLWRCLLVLSMILEFQKNSDKEINKD